VAAGNDGSSLNDAELSALIKMVQDRRVLKMLRTIQSHPSSTIHGLALECNLSESRLQHLFKQHTGLGLGQLLADQRMREATDLLAHSNMSIKEIASALGYEHASSFTRAFERYFGKTPSGYRQGRGSREMSTGMEDA
jgi:AraC family transcriptional activator of mar-sox-rob regulon